MKGSITLQRRTYQTREALADKLGVATKTIGHWARRKVLPKSLRIGRAKYYDADEVEARLIEFGMR